MSTEAFDQQAAREYFQGREIKLYGSQPAGFDGLTTNRQDYVRHPLEGRHTEGHTTQWTGNNVPFDGTSTYNSDFHHMPIPERHHAPPAQYQPSPAVFDGTSTYGAFFKPHQIERGTAVRPTGQYQTNSLPFDGSTMYRDQFVAHELPTRMNGPPAAYQPSSATFDGSTTYGSNFVPHAFEQRPPPGVASTHVSLPFNATTTYGETFRAMPILPREHVERSSYQPSAAKFEGTSESMDKFRAWAVDPANRTRSGAPPAMQPSLAFDGTTTNREMFKGWQLPPRRPALGIQMAGDQVYVLIPANAPVPALGRQSFTTVHDNQSEISMLILEGDFSQASRCNVLGKFDMVGLPPGPAGAAKIEVTYHIDGNGVLTVSALDLNTQRQEQWLRQGYMAAQV